MKSIHFRLNKSQAVSLIIIVLGEKSYLYYYLRYSQMLISHEKSDQRFEPDLATILSRSEIDRPWMKSDRMTGEKRSIKNALESPIK